MKIHIEGKTYLESDEYQYVLKTYTGNFQTYNKDKENEYERETFKVEGYYGTINQALNAVLNMKIKESTARNIGELLRDVDRIREYIREITKRETIN